jgi:hypothetical protein
MGPTELGRVPREFVTSSIMTTFGHLSFHKNWHAGKGGKWSLGSNQLIPCNVRVPKLPIAQISAIVFVVCVLNG